jgi:CBS domain-containing protein
MRRRVNWVTKPERVEQLMSRIVATCRPEDTLNRAAQIMWERDCGVVPVTVLADGGECVVGMITDRDVCMAAYTQGLPLADLPVATAMSRSVRTCAPTDRIDGALRLMAAEQLHRLPVVDEAGHLVGLLSFADVAREEARCHKVVAPEDLAKTAEAIARPRPHELTIAPSHAIGES